MNREKFILWIKLNKKKLIGFSLILIILVAAFWYGGDSKDSRGFKINESNAIQKTDESQNDMVTTENDSSENVIESENIESNETEKIHNDETTFIEETSTLKNICTESVSTKQQNIEPQSSEQTKESNTVVETTSQQQTKKGNTCTISISCGTILNNMSKLDKDKKSLIPSDGWIIKPQTVEYSEGNTVFDVLKKLCIDNKINIESSQTVIYNSIYVEGINNIYEFDCGSLSGWMFSVNGEILNYSSSKATIKNGDVIEWKYTCDLGNDLK